MSRCHVRVGYNPPRKKEPGQRALTGLVKGEEDNVSSMSRNDAHSEPFLADCGMSTAQ